MSRVAYVNGAFVPFSEAATSIEDRGYQFSDGVYEVVLVVDGKLWDADGHFARWQRSLNELAITRPVSSNALKPIIKTLLKKNRLASALVYMQSTRGVAPRNHPFPANSVSTLTMTARNYSLDTSNQTATKGVRVITTEDNRWGRVDIKTISLLPNILAKENARRQGAEEAWLVKDGFVTEGSSTNAWIIDKDGVLITHPKGTQILGGITRETIIQCAKHRNMSFVEKAFSLEDVLASREAFFTSATSLVMPVIRINEDLIGDGTPGPITTSLRRDYIDHCR